MTNNERRIALAKARRAALECAEAADRNPRGSEAQADYCALATMWAAVAEAMKVGDSMEADGVIPDPANLYDITTR